MDKHVWADHLSGWRAFLTESISRTDDFGEKVKLDRQLRAIERVRYGAALNPALVSQFIHPNAAPGEPCELDKIFLSLNDSQRKAVCSALGEAPLVLIQGPPGTGKTQVIAEICLQLLARDPNARILVCSETHVAVNNLLSRISDYTKDYRIVRIRDKESDGQSDAYSPTSIVESHVEWLSYVCDNQEAVGIIADELRMKGVDDQGDEDSSLEKALALSSNIAGMTCNRVAAYDFRDTTEMFDVAIIDEVCKATLPEILMPLLVSKKAVLVGDPMQLPPVFCSEEQDVIESIEGCNLRELMYIDELFRLGRNVVALDTQYRMVDEIGDLISRNFYDHRLVNGRNEARGDSLTWIDYRPSLDCPPTRPAVSGTTSVSNEDECKIIAKVLEEIRVEEGAGTKIAVISPYRAQVTMLRNALGQSKDLSIDTVDGFQGKESDVVIFSVARTNGPFRFVNDSRRLNVAISRARNRVIIVGCLNYCKERSSLLTAIANSCRIRTM